MYGSPGVPSVHDAAINTVICIVQMGKLRLRMLNGFAFMTCLQQTGLKGLICIISMAVHGTHTVLFSQ